MISMHDVFTVGVPLLAILAGILLNRGDVNALRAEMRGELKDVRGEMRDMRLEMLRRFDAIDAELRYFHGTLGKLDARVEALEKRNT
jgi:hypothetical protein